MAESKRRKFRETVMEPAATAVIENNNSPGSPCPSPPLLLERPSYTSPLSLLSGMPSFKATGEKDIADVATDQANPLTTHPVSNDHEDSPNKDGLNSSMSSSSGWDKKGNDPVDRMSLNGISGWDKKKIDPERSKSRSPQPKKNRKDSSSSPEVERRKSPSRKRRSRSRSRERRSRRSRSKSPIRRRRSRSNGDRKKRRNRSRDRRRRSSPIRDRKRSTSRDRRRSTSRDRRRSTSRDRRRSTSRDRRRSTSRDRRRSTSRDRRRSTSRDRRRSTSRDRRRSNSRDRRRSRDNSGSPPHRYCSKWAKPSTGLTRAVLPINPSKKKEKPMSTSEVEERLAKHMKIVKERNAEEAKRINLPGYLNPAMVNVAQFKQVQDKRKLLWSKAKEKKEGANQWTGAFDDQSSDEKFKRLMGIHGETVADPSSSSQQIQESRKVLDELQKEYEKSRAFQMSRGAGGITGIGLGFGSVVQPPP